MAAELPQTLSQALSPGTPLQEYSLVATLGMGGFGITYLATDNNLHLKVAIKEFFPSSALVRNPASGAVALKSEQAQAEYAWGRDRFMREAQTLARFSHPNIVQVFRYLEANGTCYMVMAYEEGQSLEAALAADPARWDQQAVLKLMLPLLDGLESVHAAGFLHRDIKPANIVLRAKDGSPVLIDFGAARAPAANDALTVVLSHGYGPPEQYSRQGNQGPWTDIYALAGVLYRIVSGSVPPMSLHRVQHDPIIPASFSGEGRFGPQFLAAIDLGLSVDEKKRPQSVAEWRQRLVADTMAPAAATSPPPTHVAAPAAPRTAAATAPTKRPDQVTAAPPIRPRSSVRVEEEDEPGLGARIGQTMIAHPFVSLLILVAALYGALHYLRRPATPAPPIPSPTVVSEPATPALRPESPLPPAQPPAPTEPRELVPAASPTPTSVQPPPAERTVASAPSGDGERLRDVRHAALAACEGKGFGTPCRVIGPRNEIIDATCMRSVEGLPICRPERLGPRQNEQAGPPSERQDTWRQPQRPPR